MSNLNKINDFLEYLVLHGVSPNSIKYYKSDILNFVNWLGDFETRDLTRETINDYIRDIKQSSSIKTVNRRLSTLRSFAQYLNIGFMNGVTNVIPENKSLERAFQNNLGKLSNFDKFLISQNISENTRRSYLSDVRKYLNSNLDVKAYLSSLGGLNYNRNLSSLKKYFDFKNKKFPLRSFGFPKNAPYRSLQELILNKLEKRPRLQDVFGKLFFNRPKWYIRYHSYPLANYIHLAILIVFCALSAFAVYDQVFKPESKLLAYPTTLKTPKRYLSFQGRLTDNLGNPKTVATDMVFQLYTVSSGGSSVWSSGTCSITPDSDGIFSTLLGSSCGSEITSGVFSENAEIWLGVTVGADAEATPRIQIATVAYALNSETLQGFPAGTGTSTVPYIDSTGTLVISAASPKIQSTSGTFAVEGVALTLSTPNTSNGIITINPDGTGTLDLTFEGAAPGASAVGFVNATNANITSGALYGGKVASDASGYNFIDFQSGATPTSKFSVSSTGAITTASGLTIGTTSLSETTSPTDSGAYLIGANDEFDNSSNTNVQAVLNDLDAAISAGGAGAIWTDSGTTVYVTDTTDELVIGGSSPLSSAKFSVDGDADQIQEVVQGYSSQTLDLTQWQNSSGTVLAYVDAKGGASFRPTYVDPNTKSGLVAVTYFNASTADITTIQRSVNSTAYATGTYNITSDLRGGDMSVYAANGYTGNITTATGLAMAAGTLGDGTITTATAFRAMDYSTGTGAIGNFKGLDVSSWHSANISNSYAIDIGAETLASGTAKYGIRIGNVSGATSNYAINTNAGNIVFNEGGDSATDFRVEGDTNTNLFFTDASADAVGINSTGPDAKLDVLAASGEQLRLTYTDGTEYAGFTVNATGDLTITPQGNLTITTDGTGNGEVVLPNDSIGDAEIDWGSGAGQIDVTDIESATTVNILLETEIDASSELLAIMDDETGTGLLVFGTSPTFTTDITTPAILSAADLTITPSGGQVEFSDAVTLNIGGLVDVAYNTFANAGEAPEEAAIAADNDVYIGGDLEVDGNIYAAGLVASAVTWNGITAPTADLTISMAAYNTTFNWDPGANSTETNFTLTTQGEDSTAGGDEAQILLSLSQTDNGTDVDEAADALLSLSNADANDPVGAGILFGAGTFTNFIDTPSSVFKVDGSGNVTGQDITVAGGNINTGNIALTIGDATTDSITFTVDGTGTAEIVLPNDSIGDTEIDWGSGAEQIDVTDMESATTVNILLETEIDASSELLAIMDDETGTGALVFGTSPTFTTDITTPEIKSAADLTITPTGGQMEFTDAATINIGGLVDVAYNAFANAGEAPEEGAISSDNDVYIGGDLEIDGTLYAANITATALAWDKLTNPGADLTLTMAAYNTTFNWDPGANAAETNFVLTTQGEDSTAGGDEDQVLLALSQTSNGTDVDEAADSLLTLANNDANDPVNSAIRFDAGAAGTDFTYGINFDAADIGTAEIVLENAEAIHNQTDDTFTFEDDDGTDYATLTAAALTVTGDLAITGGNITTAVTADSTLTVTGTLTANGTLDANALFTLGDNGETGAIDTTTWDIDTSGNITTAGDITLSQATPSLLLTDSDGDDYTINADANAFTIINATDARTEISFAGDGSMAIGTTTTTTVDIAGGSSSTGCTIDGSNGNFSCSGTISGSFTVTDDSLDFTKFTDTMALDADTSIAAEAGEELTYNKAYTDATGENGFVMNFTASDTSSGTTAQYGLYLNNVASTEGIDALLVLNNADADDAVTDGIAFTAGGAGTDFLDGIDFSAANVNREIVLENGEAIINQTDDTFTFEDDDGTDYATLTAAALTVTGDLAITGGNITTAVTADSTLTVTGTLTANGTLDANGIITLGDGGETVAISSSDWTLNATGDATNIGSVGMDGDLTNTQETPSLVLADSTAASDDYSINVDGNSFTIVNTTDVSTNLSIDGSGNTVLSGTLAVNGDQITTDADLTITPSGGQVILGDTATINIGGLTGTAYNALANSGEGPEETGAITADNDLYIGGDLEIDGTLYAANVTATALAWDDITAPTDNLTIAMAAYNTTFNWDPGPDGAETNLTLSIQGEDTTGTGDQDQVLLALTQTDNSTDVDEAADVLLTLANNDSNDPVENAIRFDAGAAGTDFTYGINFDAADIGTAEIVLENAETISNQTDGTILLTATTTSTSGDLGVAGTTGLTFTGTGGDITFTNGEKIDNDTDGTLTLTATNTALSGDLAVNGATSADITTTTTTATVFNATATTLSMGGAATTLNIGPTGSGASSIVLSGGSADTGCTLNGSNGNLTCSGTLSATTGLFTSNLQVNNASSVAYNRFGSATTSHGTNITDGDDLLISGDLELDGTLFLDGAQIANSNGTGSILLSGNVVTTPNTLGNGNWQVVNSSNVGQAALMVQQNASGDLFTASAGAVPKFTIDNSGRISLIDGTAHKIYDTSGDLTLDSLGGQVYLYNDDDLLPGTGTSDLGSATAVWDNIYGGYEVLSGNLTVNGGVIGSSASLLYLFDNPTTKTIYIGASSGDSNAQDTIYIASEATQADTLAFGNSNASTTFALTGGDDWSLAATGVLTLSASAAQTTALVVTDTDYTNALSIGDNNILGTTSAIDFTNFDVDASGNTTIAGSLTANGAINLGNGTGDLLTANTGAWTFSNDTNFVLSGGTNGLSLDTDTLSIDATNDRVGIGTTAPGYPLHIYGTSATLGIVDTDSQGRINLINAVGNVVSTTDLGAIYFGGTDNGTTTYGAYIQATAQETWDVTTSNTGTKMDFYITPNTTTGAVVGLRIAQSGVVSVKTLAGTTGSVALCYVAGAAGYQFSGCSSSIRYKENVAPLSEGLNSSGIDLIKSMKPVTFNWKENGEHGFGFIAEDMAAINPLFATYDKGEIMGVRYAELTAVLAQAVKEQQIEIENLTTSVQNSNIQNINDYSINVLVDNTYQTIDTFSDTVVENANAFANVIAANIKAGIVDAQKIVSENLIARNSVQTNLISPLTGTTDVVVQIGSESSESGKFVIENSDNQEVASVDVNGNAVFAGTVESENLEVTNDATVSGTLYADSINSKSLDDIQALLTKVEADQNLLKEASTWNTDAATQSASLGTFETLTAANLFVTNQIASNLMSVTQSLTVGSDLVIGSNGNSLDSLSNPLKIQGLALAPVEIMAGLVTIDTNGNVNIAKDLNVAGKITTPTAEVKDITIEKFTIAASVDASTSAEIINGETSSNATAGQAKIPAGQSEIVIKNSKVTDYSLIYVTPTSSTQNNVLFVKEKAVGSFKVGFTNPIDSDVDFNWWIIETK